MAERLYTPKAIISYPNLFVARASNLDDNATPKFSATFVFDKAAQATPEFAALKKALVATAKEKWGDKPPANLKNPFLDGPSHNLPEGTVFIRCSSLQQPGVVNAKVQKIIDPSEIYPGAIVIATVSCYAWERKTGKGVSFGLGNVQKVGDGPRIDNRSAATDDFKPIEGADASADVDSLFG
jgi:hypothetical protein